MGVDSVEEMNIEVGKDEEWIVISSYSLLQTPFLVQIER